MKKSVFENIELRAVSSATPKNRIDLKTYGSRYGEELVDRIIQSTGIKEVAVSPEEQTCSDLCVSAAEHLFNEYEISPNDIDGLVYVSETADYIAPTTAAILQDRLNIPKNCVVFEIHLSCSGYVYGLFQAAMMINCGFCKNVILLVGSTMTRYMNKEDRAMQMISGDAGSASLISFSEKKKTMHFSFFSDGSGYKGLMIPAGGIRNRIKSGVTDILEFDDEGNGHTKEDLIMDGMAIMVFSTRVAPKLIKEILQEANLSVDDIDIFLLHQANKIIVERIGKLIKAPVEKVPLGLEKTGNTGLTSVPLMMCNKFAGINNGLKKSIICGFGSGLVAASCLIDLSDTIFIKTIEV